MNRQRGLSKVMIFTKTLFSALATIALLISCNHAKTGITSENLNSKKTGLLTLRDSILLNESGNVLIKANTKKLRAANQTTPEDYGAIANDGIDDSVAIQAAADHGDDVLFGENKIYELENLLSINNPTKFYLNGSKLFSSSLTRLISIKSEFMIRDGVIETTINAPKEDLLGILYCVNENIDNIELYNIHFEGNSVANINAIKFDCSKKSGSIIKNIYMDKVSVSNIGRMAGEAIAHTNDDGSDTYIGNIFIRNYKTNNTGTLNKYGMAWSTSGNVKNTVIDGIEINDWDDIGIENAGGTYFSVTNAKITDPKDPDCRYVAVFNNKGYNSNEKTVFENCNFIGNAKIQLNGKSSDKPIVFRNSNIDTEGRIETKNATFISTKIRTSSSIQSLAGGLLKIENGTINFTSEAGRIDAINAKVYIENSNFEESLNGQTLLAVHSEIIIKDSRFLKGYLNVDALSTVKLINVDYSTPKGDSAFRGKGRYTIENKTTKD